MKARNILAAALLLAMVSAASADRFGTDGNQFTIDFVTISGSTNPSSGYGIVNNDYRMGKFEITNGQWDKFKAAYGPVTGSTLEWYPYSPYDESPYWTGTTVPTDNVSWYEAAQFVNWLNTSTGHHVAYKFTGTQGQSDYTLSTWVTGDVGYNSANPYRNSNTKYYLPTENEWVKAAYWNGTELQTYATKAGETLFQGNGSNGGWNYDDNAENGYVGPWAVGSGSQELNGTYDMMGNVWEWMESPWESGDYGTATRRGQRGGSYIGGDGNLLSSTRTWGHPYEEDVGLGFRVASEVPEPASLGLITLGGLALLKRRRR